jgi:tetratricopeptide (TPR) repeat protein
VSSPALAQRPARLERELAQADRAAQAGQTARARRIWVRAARRAPQDGRAALRLAAALPQDVVRAAALGETLAPLAREADDALVLHLAALGENATPEARRARAWSLALGGDHARAVEAVAAMVSLQDAECAALLSRLAALAVHREDLRSARRALESAHRALPQDSDVLADLAAVELALGDAGRAVERFARVVARRPSDVDARRDLAGALLAAGRGPEAIAALEEAARLRSEAPELRLELARAALEAGQPAVAERAARAAISALASDDGRGHAVLGAALAAQRRRAEAEAALSEALRRDPDDVRARQVLDALRGGR